MFRTLLAALFSTTVAAAPAAPAVPAQPVELATSIHTEIFQAMADPAVKGDLQRLRAVLDRVAVPHMKMVELTARMTGKGWRQGTPEQQERLVRETHVLLLRSWAQSLQYIEGDTTPAFSSQLADDTTVTVRVRLKGSNRSLTYRMVRRDEGWLLDDVDTGGGRLSDQYYRSYTARVAGAGFESLVAHVARMNAEASARADVR